MNISVELLFETANLLILPAWIILMFAPQWHWTKKIITTGYYTVGFSILYLLIITFNFDLNNFNFNTLDNVKKIFSNDYFLVAGWVHYLAFDLLVGTWIVKDAEESEIQSPILVPILAFCFYLGPIGYLTYRVYKFIKL